ncbi:Gp138 family membrane-puncturing spike protein [Serratia marcescens]|nr:MULTISPECIES: Gp138 family membrane-puncturing spike protein [Serratia]MBH3206953.1 oxidoreductase [Serratia marcescens]MBN5325851.1 oxidoreductase [Serratia marcescens]MBN5347563.1 oxidoreductase [Serratia marcescens]MDP8617879.1 Gp138 family membrane-puncturing spike protein [Serratia marcescens]MDP8629871.1 Gp138 family membrane-puncturing spike protein [Serratia marcescens]
MENFHVNGSDLNGDINAQDFVMRQFLGRHAFITLGWVINAYKKHVDIRPMVMDVAGDGSPIAHEVIYNVPVWRLQGGKSAVIMPPEVGDIGLIAICDRDISAVKATHQPAMPGSRRTHNLSDALYLGGVLNGDPVQFVEFANQQINVTSPWKITLNAPDIEANGAKRFTVNAPEIALNGATEVSQKFTAKGKADLSAGAMISGIEFGDHVHGGVQSGGGKTNKPE